jgi:hypothetical protein
MAKQNARLDAARKAYREALEAARASPTPEAWAKLLAAGKELSTAEDPRSRGRRTRRRPAPVPEERPDAVDDVPGHGEGAEER